jgi:hypothetical protein
VSGYQATFIDSIIPGFFGLFEFQTKFPTKKTTFLFNDLSTDKILRRKIMLNGNMLPGLDSLHWDYTDATSSHTKVGDKIKMRIRPDQDLSVISKEDTDKDGEPDTVVITGKRVPRVKNQK